MQSGWTYHPNTEYMYKYFDLSLNPTQANQYCETYNGLLLNYDRFFTHMIFKKLTRSVEVLASTSSPSCSYLKYNVDTQVKECIVQNQMESTKLPFVCQRKGKGSNEFQGFDYF